MKKILSVYILFSCVLLQAEDFGILKQALDTVMQNHNIIGSSVSIVLEDETFDYGYGLRDVDRNLDVDLDTKYRIASISKLLPAVCAMQLVEDGLLDLDADISDYLGFTLRNPNFPETPILLKYIMTHTSSLRDTNPYFNFLNASYSENQPTIEELFQENGTYYQSNIWSSYYEPGEFSGWDYSNLSSGLLATIIERVTGEFFWQYCKTNVTDPLEMDCCWSDYENISDINDVSVLYRIQNGTPTPQADNFQGVCPSLYDWNSMTPGNNAYINSPQGGLRVSSKDLMNLMRMFLNHGTYNGNEILQSETVETMESLYWSGSGLGGFFTEMGMQIQRTYDVFPNELFFGHAGEAYGLLSDFYYNRDRNFGLIFIMNGGTYTLNSVFYDIEDEVFSTIKDWLDSSTAIEAESNLDIAPFISLKNKTIQVDFHENIKSIQIYNLRGQKKISKKIESRSSSINMQHFSKGIYFIKIDTKSGSYTKKMLYVR